MSEPVRRLHDAVLDAFTLSTLRRAVEFGTDVKLDHVAGGSDLSSVVYALIDEFDRRDALDLLVSALRQANPTNEALAAVEDELEGRHPMTRLMHEEKDLVGRLADLSLEVRDLRSALYGNPVARQPGVVDRLDRIDDGLSQAKLETAMLLARMRILQLLIVLILAAVLLVFFSVWVVQWTSLVSFVTTVWPI